MYSIQYYPLIYARARAKSWKNLCCSWVCIRRRPYDDGMMISPDAVTDLVPGAKHETDGSIKIPIYHHSTGEVMGWQTRHPDGSMKYSTGIKTREAAPTTLGTGTNGIAIATEGPTDAIAAAQHNVAEESLIVGCWSSSTLPPQEWWDINIINRRMIVIACGDGDRAGSDFNQRIANAAGFAHVCRIPAGEDLRSTIENLGVEEVNRMMHVALLMAPLRRREQRAPITRTDIDLTGIDIISLVESAGAKRRSSLSSGQFKYLCPLHDDRRDPSLTVDPSTGSWKCWAGCGQGGPAQWVMAARHCDYHDAMRYLEGQL